ncbi:ABC transporter substrate-binding protein [Endozoicomonadaceae bacterium StTr2]
MRTLTLFLLALVLSNLSIAETASTSPVIKVAHGIARFDDLKYPADFSHFDYVNPNAPKAGNISLFAFGAFDSLNAYAAKGLTPSQSPMYRVLHYGFSELNEPLMVGSGQYDPSGDEFHSAYGLIAASVEYPEDNSWIIFNLRPEARFHDGHPIEASDVVFSLNELKEKGHPRFRMQLESVTKAEVLNRHRVKFYFGSAGTRSQLFRVAELPVLPEHYWKERDLGRSSIQIPLNSGPYRITAIEPGLSITFSRVKDYWGKDLPVNRGKYNFDEVKVYFYRDLDVAFEAFKAGGHDLHAEMVAKNWALAYDFPAISKGLVKRHELDYSVPYGSMMFFFNTRRSFFNDIRVRQAMTLLFDFESVNRRVFHGAYRRINSYFPHMLSAKGIAGSSEVQLLEPWRDQLPGEVFTQPYQLPVNSGEDDGLREQRYQALALLKQAGWQYKKGELIHESTGEVFKVQYISPSKTATRYVLPFANELAKVGIDLRIQVMDQAQYMERLQKRDFDMVGNILPQTFSPDIELQRYFHSSSMNDPSTLNLSGVSHPAIDFITERIPRAQSREELETLVSALDRVLLWNFYAIPRWRPKTLKVACRDIFVMPETLPKYATSFRTWWYKEKTDQSAPQPDDR